MSFPYHLSLALVSYFGFQRERICEGREPPAPLTERDLLHAGGDKSVSFTPEGNEWAATEPQGQRVHNKGTQKMAERLKQNTRQPRAVVELAAEADELPSCREPHCDSPGLQSARQILNAHLAAQGDRSPNRSESRKGERTQSLPAPVTGGPALLR